MDLRDYVAYYRTHGYTDEQLEEHLVHQGYKEEEVKAALNAGKVPWLLISVIAVVMLLFGVGIFFFMSTLSEVTQLEVPREVLEANQVFIPEELCDDKVCAEEALAKCEPMKGSYSVFLLAELEYEILGSKGEWCEVYAYLIKAPKKELEGKDMTCLVDSSLPIKDALKDLSRCDGPLVEAYAQMG